MIKRISVIFLALTILFPGVVYFINFNAKLSQKNADWGDFGSYIGGTVGVLLSALSFIILAYTLYITIKYNEANKRIALLNFKTERRSLIEQLKHQKKELNLQLVKSYSESLAKHLDSKEYFRYHSDGESKKKIDKQTFLNEALEEFIRMKGINPKSDFQSLAFCAINKFRVRYDDECILLGNIDDIIISEENDVIKRHLFTLFTSTVNNEDLFWLRMYLCECSEGYQDKIFKNKLFNTSSRILDAFPEHHKRRAQKK